ncbi:anion permease, partial [Solidesulfovibrio sp.]|uniref:anion permease n=1 Tax=Solidesulfovibrio sp. TaxID=2910990 RepID=UPI0026131DAD
MKKSLRYIIPLLVGLIIWVLPVPQGLSANAWEYFAIFMAVILGLILEPLPPPVCGLLGVGLIASLMLVPPTAPPMPAAKPAATAYADYRADRVNVFLDLPDQEWKDVYTLCRAV